MPMALCAAILATPWPPSAPPNPPIAPSCQGSVGSPGCSVHVGIESCTFFRGGAQLNRKCLVLSRAYYLSFIAGSCWENLGQSEHAATDCFDITSGGLYYGQYIDYFASSGGIVLSAALAGNDFAGLGFANAPPSGDGSIMPAEAAGPVASLLQTCSDLHANLLCDFGAISSACPCACAATACPDAPLDDATKVLAHCRDPA